MTQSGGILVYRKRSNVVEVLLLHPGGPFWAKKDAWSIPKGELDADEDHLTAAKREFEEELGVPPPEGEMIDLGSTKQPGKLNSIWAIEGDYDTKKLRLPSMFTMEWPPKSSQNQEFPENDKAKWFDLATAKTKLFKAQVEFIDRLAEKLGVTVNETSGDVATETSGNEQTSLL